MQPRRILVIKPCCLGDVLLTTPLIAALRQAYPKAAISYAVGPWSRPMVAGNLHLDQLITIPERWTLSSFLTVARELRRRRFDIVFVPHRSPIPGLLTLLAGIPERVGLDSGGRGFAYTRRVAVPSGVIHEADLYLGLADAVGIARPERRLSFFPSDADRHEADQLLRQLQGPGPLVVLHPGGGSNPGMVLARKRWLPERWAEVADRLYKQHGARVLIVGSAGESPIADEVRTAMCAPATTITRQWRWGVLGALVQAADLFLGHDTGMSLLANAVGTPHVVVFGPSDPQIYGPYGAWGRYVWRPTAFSPCFLEGWAPEQCPCAGACMRNVQVEDVLRLVETLITEFYS